MRQNLYRISGFQIALARTRNSGKLPWRYEVVNERIVHPLRDFMAQREYIRDSTRKDDWIRPGREDERLYLLAAISI